MDSKRATGITGVAMGAALSLMSAPSMANLLEYQFQSVDGEIKTASPGSSYVNPTGPIQFTLSAGLDRKVRVSLINEDGETTESKVSHLLGVTDRIKVNGKDYYGTSLTLNAPSDGDYEVLSEIVSSQGESVQSETFSLIVDTTPPSASPITATNSGYGQVTSGPVWKTGRGGSAKSYFRVSNIEDASPIAGGQIALYREDGSLYREQEVSYDAVLGQAQVTNNSGFFPTSNLDEDFQVQMRIEDAAGNVWKSERQTVRWDNVSNGPSAPFGVYVPGSTNVLGPGLTGYVPYEAGMEVHTNPIQLAWRVPRNNWHEYREGGLSLVNSLGKKEVVGTDADYVYIVWSAPIGNTNHNYTRWSNFGQWGGTGIYYNLKLSDSAPKTPVLKSVEYHFSDVGWHSFYRRTIQNSLLPLSFDKIRLTGEVRNYDQIAYHRGSCTIPAGEASCVIDAGYTMNPGTTGYIHNSATIRNSDKTLMASVRYAEVNWNDQHYPALEYEYNEEDKEITVFVNQPGRGAYFDRLRLESAWIEDHEGQRLSPSGGKVEENGQNYAFKWDLKTLPEGNFQLFAAAKERHGPETKIPLFEFLSDRSAPVVDISVPAENISSLDGIAISISDRFDPDPKIVDIRLEGGPANELIQLSWRENSPGQYRLEYPLMFPSQAVGESYNLVVTAEDSQGNQGVAEQAFAFKPSTNIVNGENGVLMPAINQSITGGGLPPIYSEPVEIDDGTLVVGEYDLVATLRADSDFGINMMGYELLPGDTIIIDNYDFSANDSKIALPAYPTESVVGQANLLIFPGAPGAQYVLAQINTWKPNPVVTVNEKPFGEGLSIQEAIEPVTIKVTGGPGDPCTYTSDEAEAVAANPLLNPMCTIAWDLPDTITWDPKEYVANGYLTGVEEDAEVGYQVFVPQNAQAKGVEVGAEKVTVDVVHPDLEFAFDPDEGVTRYITEFAKSVKNVGNVECAPTVNPADARVGTKYGYPKCLIEWNFLPEGIAASNYTPIVQGVAQEEEQIEFTFDVTYFDPDQNAYFLPEQTLTIPVDPPKPVEITMPESDYEPSEDGNPRYFVGLDGEYLGEAHLSASGADIDMDISKDGENVQSLPYLHRGGRDRDADYPFRIWMDDLQLWEESAMEIKGAYQLMPEINTAKQATVIGVPSTQMRAKLEMDGRKLLDTDEVSVDVRLEGRALYDGYQPHEHGVWKVQIRYEEKDGDIQNLTGWKFLEDDGSVTANLTLGERNDGYMFAVMQLDSPYEEYSRELLSNRNYVNVLRGGEIQGDITASRVSGRSVFTAFLRVQVDDQSYDNSLGEVEWLISEDEGATWSPVEDGARGNYMKGDFNAGRYWVKARLHNKYTDAVSETGVQQIHVYDVPRVDIEGAQYAFKTQEVELRATATLDWEPVPIENYHVEWSADGGESWEPGLTTTAKYDGETDRVRYRVRVRDMDAPMDEEGIWRERSHRLNFIDPVGPRTRIYGPRRLERGDPGDYEVEMNPPRRNMDVEMAGEWQLPDGTIIPGSDMITYNPSEKDVTDGRVELIYRSWVKGFRDQGAIDERVHRISAWQYVWPEWDVFANTRAMEAPAEIRLTPRTPGWFGWLDNEKYDWTFPAGTTQLYDNDKRPTIRIEEAGEHEVTLLVSDARGNETKIVKSLVLEEPSPTEIDFSFYTDNEFMRAPLEVRPRIYMRGGHRLDRVKEREILINGESLVRDTRIRSFVIKEPGFYEVTAVLYSRMGREVSTTQTIEVVPNKPPVCEPKTDDRFGYLIIEANCSDSDGDIEEIRWEMAGEELPSSSYKYRFTEDQIAENNGRIQIQVSAQDDAGVFSQRETVIYTAP